MKSQRRWGPAVVAAAIVATGPVLAARAETIPLDADLGEVTGITRDEQGRTWFATPGAAELQVLDEENTLGEPATFDADVESIQALSFHRDELYVGDTGGERETFTVHRLPADTGEQQAEAIEFTYPDGAHEAQALAVSAKGRIYVVTTGDDAAIYRSTLDYAEGSPNALTRVIEVPAGVTDAAFLAGGSSLLLRTADGVQVLDAYSWESLGVTTYVGGRAGESIAQFDGAHMLVGDGAQLRVEPLPDGDSSVTPEPVAEPTQSASAAPSPSASAAPAEEADDTEVARRGTITALVAAGVVSVLAGVMVFLAPSTRPGRPV